MKTLLFLFCMSWTSPLWAQSDLMFIGSAADGNTAGNFHVDWTVGESVVATLENSDITLTTGFLQAIVTKDVSVAERPDIHFALSAFPNPFVDHIELNSTMALIDQVQLVNSMGQELIVQQWSDGQTQSHFDVSNLASGHYILIVWDQFNQKHTFPLVKTQ